MNRGITRRHRGMTAATRLHRTVTAAILLRRILNRAAAAVVAVHRHTVVEVLPLTVAEVVATAIRNRPQIPSTASVLAPSLRI